MTDLDLLIEEARSELAKHHPSSGPGNYWKVRLDALEDAEKAIRSEH